MSVTGYLSLYTTLLGWQQYQALWDLVTQTGLIYLPFLVIIVSSLSTFGSMGAKDASQIALRRMGAGVISALFVIAFAAVPTVNLDPKVLHYEPTCTPQPKIATPGHTGTTYDNAFTVPAGVKVPILWYLVMAFSNGMTHAANSSLSCAPIDYRQLHSQLNLATISDPSLKKDVSQFYNDCYVPSYSDYIARRFGDSTQSKIDASIKQHGIDDVKWLGSNTFQTVAGFYSDHQASSAVTGFAFNPERDVADGQLSSVPKWGRPMCLQWWQDPNHGLHKKLSDALPVSVVQSILHLGKHTQVMEDAAIETLITHSFDENLSDAMRGYESGADNGSHDWVSTYIGAPLGLTLSKMKYYPKLHLLINALPVIQGSLLFALYAFLALALPFARYRISFCVTASMMMFSLIFCSYIWHLVAWFDNHLIDAIYPQIKLGGGIFNSTIDSDFVDMIIGTLYIVLPVFWMSVMSWASFKVGGFIGGLLSGMSGPADSGGQAAGSLGDSAIRMGAGRVMK